MKTLKINDKKVPALIMISDLNGKTVWKETAQAPLVQDIDLSAQNPGLYILTVAVGDAKMSEQIKLD